MKALWILVCSLGVLGTGAMVVSIMGSGPCTPPPCTSETEGEFCQDSCNGPKTFCCREGVCGNCAPCSNEECPPAPPCSTAVCINPAYCGDSSAEGAICCRYDYWKADISKCPLSGDNPDNPSNWHGTCNGDHQCIEP